MLSLSFGIQDVTLLYCTCFSITLASLVWGGALKNWYVTSNIGQRSISQLNSFISSHLCSTSLSSGFQFIGHNDIVNFSQGKTMKTSLSSIICVQILVFQVPFLYKPYWRERNMKLDLPQQQEHSVYRALLTNSFFSPNIFFLLLSNFIITFPVIMTPLTDLVTNSSKLVLSRNAL